MPQRLETIWALEPHTGAKHEILRRYLDAWYPILGSWNDRIVYIDGFAGPGRYKGGEPGSPLIAIERFLEAKRNGRVRDTTGVFFLFVERDEKRCAHLLQELSNPAYASLRREVRCQPFTDVMSEIWGLLDEQKRNLAPTFAVIDPFGFSHTPYAHIQKILSYPSTEVLFTFMYEEANRFITHPDLESRFDELFGTQNWRFLKRVQGVEDRKSAFREFFRDRLTAGGAQYVLVFEMKNASNATDYFLFFATKNRKGLKAMKGAMWKADSTGEYTFSDYTYALGPTLLTTEPNYRILQDQLIRKFGGREVDIDEIELFVLAETSFYHYNREALKPLEAAQRISARKVDGTERRKGTFPRGTLVRFN